MGVCPKCHKFKRKYVLARHRKVCLPSRFELEHYLNSKSGSSHREGNK